MTDLKRGMILPGLILLATGMQAPPIEDCATARGTYTDQNSGGFTAQVTKGKRGQGVLGGSSSYSYDFDQPSRPALSVAQCTPSAPVVGSGGCHRDCVKSDSYKVYQTGVLTGVPAIGATPGCVGLVSGTSNNITLTEAYDRCEVQNAWGGNTFDVVIIKVGPLFHFNNPRTQHVGKCGHMKTAPN